MNVTVQFTPQKMDLVWAGYAALRAEPIIFFTNFIFFIVLPWLGAIIFSAEKLMGKSIGWGPIALLIILPPITVTAMALLPVFLSRGSRTLRGIHTYELSDSNMHFTGPGFNNTVEWGIVTRCVRTHVGLMLFSGRFPLVSLPHRVLSEVDYLSVQELLTTKAIPFS